MEHYPVLKIDLEKLRCNGVRMVEICAQYGVSVCAVVKGINAQEDCCRTLSQCGFSGLASSRVSQLKQIKELDPNTKTMLIRIPMFDEVEMAVRYADVSLVSEVETLRRINEEAARQHKTHGVVLMYDLGDLREGFPSLRELTDAAMLAEKELAHVNLEGIGTNLSCYGSIIPTEKNMGELARAADETEARIGRRLDLVSGGATTVIPLMLAGKLPQRINHLRLGECLYSNPLSWRQDVSGMNRDVFTLRAQIVEQNSKPTFPIGERGVAAFGKVREYEDRGVRRRAILAIGNQDLGDAKNALLPRDARVKLLGASGDHLIADIEDCGSDYRLGDCMEFDLTYQGLVYSTMSPYVSKEPDKQF